MMDAFARIALLQFRQVQPSAEMVALPVNDSGPGVGRKVRKDLAESNDHAIVQRIALGGST
jgi:hypothetical protein